MIIILLVQVKNGSFGFVSVGLCVGKNQMCHLRTGLLIFLGVRDSLRLIVRLAKIVLKCAVLKNKIVLGQTILLFVSAFVIFSTMLKSACR